MKPNPGFSVLPPKEFSMKVLLVLLLIAGAAVRTIAGSCSWRYDDDWRTERHYAAERAREAREDARRAAMEARQEARHATEHARRIAREARREALESRMEIYREEREF